MVSKERKLASVEEFAEGIVKVLDDMNGDDIEVINISKKSSVADIMIVASGGISRKVVAMAEAVRQEIICSRGFKAKIEGEEKGDWVIVDGHDVIVHIFRPEVRSFYKIEEIWR